MKLACNPQDFRVPVSGKKAKPLKLTELPTSIDKLYKNKKDYRSLMESFTEELRDLQRILYAHGTYSLLLIFQGMDTAGKDGAIRHVMSGVNPQGCQVHSFKQPSSEELAHDFLWRTTKRLPMRGRIGIFNRSYYEEVLIVKAVPEVLAAQSLPEGYTKQAHFWPDRYRDIVNFEDYLHRNGTQVLKFFLHLSKEEQRQRLLSRAEEADKHWKISKADLESRAQWDDFQKVYGECLQQTSHALAPWYSIPADDKRNARLIISHILVEALRALPMKYPEPDKKHLAEVKRVREVLKHEGKE
ncbi:MAG: polyphosphate kinase 2 family protein [Opitutales bacterium]|nr:polyphosphate kinase 2 family protein [Opitutales bacterium]MCH8541767.1 polyphosphate kinase 2 family protein [Opitutales bacterium]